jgi:branched-chain amino acid transport system substrate-binding protein
MSVIAVLVIISTLCGCSNENETIKIGFIGTLSGPYSNVGVMEMYGTQYAVKTVNEEGGIQGREVELFIRDDEANKEIAISMQNELKDLGCDFIIGHSLSIVAPDIVSNANEKDILLLSPSIGTDSLSNIDDNFIRNVSTVYGEAYQIGNIILEEDLNKIGLIYSLDNYVLTEYHVTGLTQSLMESSFDMDNFVTLGFNTTDENSINEVKEMLNDETYDSFLIASSSIDAALFVNYLRHETSSFASVHLTSWASSNINDQIDVLGKIGLFLYTEFNHSNLDPDYLAFKNEFLDFYGIELEMLSANAYDLSMVLINALKDTKDHSISNIKQIILTKSSFEGINSSFDINEYGDCIKEFYQLQLAISLSTD